MKEAKSKLSITQIKSPLGEITVCASHKGICLLEFSDGKLLDSKTKQLETALGVSATNEEDPVFKLLSKQLNAYFNKEITSFDLPLHLIGTDFQVKVWNVLSSIPYGSTISYLEQSKLLGNEKAIRASASANGKNPIAIVIPCHRVIGKNGTLTGYAGGLWRKKKLLELEGVSKFIQ